jgi:uncharacterized delta-60 repeat protein
MLLASSTLLVSVRAADGDLDPAFGTAGKLTTDFGSLEAGTSVAVQSDGKIVAVGLGVDSNGDGVLVLARYGTNGVLDAMFGVGGKVITDFVTSNLPIPNNFIPHFDVAIQNDDKIVVAGAYGAPGAPTDFGVERFNTNGDPDPNFGIGGRVTTDFLGFTDGANSVAIQSDGKIVVAGMAQDPVLVSQFALARYDTSGNLDGGFGAGGKVMTTFAGLGDFGSAVAIQNDGKIVAAGTVNTGNTKSDFGLARYDTSGNLDGNFGNGGKVTTDFSDNDEASSIAIQPSDGKIVVAGAVTGAPIICSCPDFGLARYETNGNLDSTFGVGGKVTTDFFNLGDYANDVVIQGDGKIVAAGWVNPDPSDIELFRDFGIVRYDTSGNVDPTFGNGGKVITDFGGVEEGAGLAIRQDCKIVVTGYTWRVDAGDFDFALAAYDSGGCVVAAPHKCPLSQGYWKNHAANWPVNSLTLGSQSYAKVELLAILNNSTQTDASMILARQLIAAKINLANGSDPAPVSARITHADGLLSGFAGKLPYKVKTSSVIGQAMTTDAGVLESYNLGLLTSGCLP